MDSIWMQLLTFALPGGFLGSVFTWIFSRRKQNNDFLKELQSSINLLSGENKKILEENIQLRRENIDLKANQEEMLVRIDRLTKEVERLRRTIGKRTSHEDNTLFGTAHRTAGELCADDGSGRHSDRKRPARASLRARRQRADDAGNDDPVLGGESAASDSGSGDFPADGSGDGSGGEPP